MLHAGNATVIGSAGVTLLLVAFFLNLMKLMRSDGWLYLFMNFVGAAMSCYSSYLIHFMPFVVLEGTWAGVAALGVARKAGVFRTSLALAVLSLLSPYAAVGQTPSPVVTAFEMRLAEKAPAPGLVEAAVPDSPEKVYLHREAIVTNADVVRATVVPGITSVNFNVAVTFSDAGAAKMAKATAAHLNKPVAILINGRVVAAPVVRAQIANEAVISGDFDRTQATAIAAGLNRR